MVTLKDVAALAQVSLATASLALNDSPKISAQTKERVIKAAEKLDYVTNARARALVRKSTGSIALVIPSVKNLYFGELAQAIKDYLRPYEYQLILCDTGNNPDQEKEYIRFLRQGGADGAIFASSSDLVQRHNHLLVTAARKSPIVLVERTIPGDPLPTVDSARMQGALQATQFLISLGHQRIAFIGGYLEERQHMSQRLQGYKQALLEANLPFYPNYVIDSDYTIEGGYEAGKVIAQLEPRPTAVFASNDLMAFGAINALIASGIKVPHEISVCGFDDLWISKTYNPPLTTVRIPTHDIGTKAAELLINMLNGNRGNEPARIVFNPHLVIRESVKPPLIAQL